MRTTQKEIDLLVAELAKEAGLTTSKEAAKQAGQTHYLDTDYNSVYGGYRLVMVNTQGGGHAGAFGYSGTEARVKASEFAGRLRALIQGINYAQIAENY